MVKNKLLREHVALSPKQFLRECPESPALPVMQTGEIILGHEALPTLGYKLAYFT